VLGWTPRGWQCCEFLLVGEHNPLFNPSDVTEKGQPHRMDPKSSCPGKGDALALPCPGTQPPGGQAQQGLGSALLPIPRHRQVMVGVSSHPRSRLCPEARHGHGHQAPCPPEGPGGQQGLTFPSACSGGQRGPKSGARCDGEGWGQERGHLAHPQSACAGTPPLGQTPDRPHSRKAEHPHRLKPWDHPGSRSELTPSASSATARPPPARHPAGGKRRASAKGPATPKSLTSRTRPSRSLSLFQRDLGDQRAPPRLLLPDLRTANIATGTSGWTRLPTPTWQQIHTDLPKHRAWTPTVGKDRNSLHPSCISISYSEPRAAKGGLERTRGKAQGGSEAILIMGNVLSTQGEVRKSSAPWGDPHVEPEQAAALLRLLQHFCEEGVRGRRRLAGSGAVPAAQPHPARGKLGLVRRVRLLCDGTSSYR